MKLHVIAYAGREKPRWRTSEIIGLTLLSMGVIAVVLTVGYLVLAAYVRTHMST